MYGSPNKLGRRGYSGVRLWSEKLSIQSNGTTPSDNEEHCMILPGFRCLDIQVLLCTVSSFGICIYLPWLSLRLRSGFWFIRCMMTLPWPWNDEQCKAVHREPRFCTLTSALEARKNNVSSGPQVNYFLNWPVVAVWSHYLCSEREQVLIQVPAAVWCPHCHPGAVQSQPNCKCP